MKALLAPDEIPFMDRAVRLGRKGWGRTHPNPLVGCVLVRDGAIVGEGWHVEYGGGHAEIHALREAGEKARGSTAYVSLEPCDHFGKTPPCSAALRKAGVSRLVFGARDPGPVSGGGGETLRKAGMEVLGPVLSPTEARRENPAFFFNQEQGATFVAIKLAQTLDGRIAGAPGQRTPITGPEARAEAHRLRAGFDGILVGSETMLVDDPLLTVREDVPVRKPPTRLILDTQARTPPQARVFEDIDHAPVVIFTGPDAPSAAVRELEMAGAEVQAVPRGRGGVSLEAVLDGCWDLGIRSVFCEGGGTLASALLEAERAGRLFLFVAPFVLGEEGVPAFPSGKSKDLWGSWSPAGPPGTFGRDILLTYDRMD